MTNDNEVTFKPAGEENITAYSDTKLLPSLGKSSTDQIDNNTLQTVSLISNDPSKDTSCAQTSPQCGNR